MKTTLNSMVGILQDNNKVKYDKSFYGVVESTIVKDNKIVGYNVVVGDSVIEARKLAGANVGDTVLCSTLSNGAVVITGALNGDKDALYAKDLANDINTGTFAEDTYTDGTHDVWKTTDDEGFYYYYWIDSLGQEHIVQESDLQKDDDGNLIVRKSLSGMLDIFKDETATNFDNLQTDINSRPTTSDVQQQIEGFSEEVDGKINVVASAADNARQLAQQATEQADKYRNYIQFTTDNGLRVGYVENRSHVDIDGNGIEIYNSQGNKSIDIEPAITTIPTLDTTYHYWGNYIIQYKSSTDEIICRKV